ncbi:glycosyltransferase [Maribacter sp. CXY002]|uniref:glycosyltransferase n=1 Tax=Maribacter luteocoastalis TaxID=3407671 RepID=UPI003B6725E9
MQKQTLVISSINFFEGGPLSILTDCLVYLNNSSYPKTYRIIALVHKKGLFDQKDFENIEFVAFPKSRTSYIYRLYYEYFHFKKFAEQHNASFWLSLHDITPNIGNVPQAVYCHNPSPFNKLNVSDLYIQPVQFFFRLFYKYLYQINIKRNKYVIVQQLWIKQRFKEMFGLEGDQIMVATPQLPIISKVYLNKCKDPGNEGKSFFFPTFPRPFKNIEVICEAVKVLSYKTNEKFKVVITIDGSENTYSKRIVEKYGHLKSLDFIGLIKRDEVYEHYSTCDCLIFPSKLETWGLPISEFKQFNKQMLLADKPYARETVGHYEKVNFFNVDDPTGLANLMLAALSDHLISEKTVKIIYEQPFAANWDGVFKKLLH